MDVCLIAITQEDPPPTAGVAVGDADVVFEDEFGLGVLGGPAAGGGVDGEGLVLRDVFVLDDEGSVFVSACVCVCVSM